MENKVNNHPGIAGFVHIVQPRSSAGERVTLSTRGLGEDAPAEMRTSRRLEQDFDGAK